MILLIYPGLYCQNCFNKISRNAQVNHPWHMRDVWEAQIWFRGDKLQLLGLQFMHNCNGYKCISPWWFVNWKLISFYGLVLQGLVWRKWSITTCQARRTTIQWLDMAHHRSGSMYLLEFPSCSVNMCLLFNLHFCRDPRAGKFACGDMNLIELSSFW